MQQAYDCPPLTVLTHAVPRGNYVQNGAALLSFLNGLFSKLLFGDPMSMELVNISSDLALALILVRTHNVTPLPPALRPVLERHARAQYYGGRGVGPETRALARWLACWLAVLRGGVQQPRVRDHLRAASRGAGAHAAVLPAPTRPNVIV
jgi:hypothetical protein